MKQNELKDLFNGRVGELLSELSDALENPDSPSRTGVDSCYLGAVSVVDAVYGARSAQAKALSELKKQYTKTRFRPSIEIMQFGSSLGGFLINIRDEIDGGYVRNIFSEAAGEIIGDMVFMAKSAMKEGHINVASVLASAAFEDAIKRFAEINEINCSNKTLAPTVNALKTKGHFSGAQGPIIKSYINLRNYALHAKWDKISAPDVTSMLGFLDAFLVEHFS